MKKSELYVFRRDLANLADKTIKSVFVISGVRSPPSNIPYNSTKEIVEYLIGLTRAGNDIILLYESLDNKVEGKPKLTLTRDSVIVESYSSPTILRDVQKNLIEILGQK